MEVLSASCRLFRTNSSGAASVEFALISTVLLLLFVAGIDFVLLVSAKRDADRASMLIAHAMATCPNSSCMSDFIGKYSPRKANALVRQPSAALEMYMIQNQNGTIKPCSGIETQLTDSKLIASAKNVLRHNDVGSAVVMTTSYKSMFPNYLMGYISSSGISYSGRTIDVMGNIGSVC
jgi:Flp pilus assembly protein TadG